VSATTPQIRIETTGPCWARSSRTYARGYAHLDGRFLSAAGIAEAAESCADDPAWAALVARLNGCFAIVSDRGDHALAAVDRVRTIPLFYGEDASRAVVSDDAYRIPVRDSASPLDADAELEFCLTGYVTGSQTLRTGVRQLEAGTWMRIEAARPAAVAATRYHAFRHGEFFPPDPAALIDRLDALHRAVFGRLLDGIGDRPIVVPLSGGYDSRLIGVSLRDLGARNVTCYSYGMPGNWEARISQELASYLGYRWEFVPYSAERWRRWAATAAFREYFRAAGNLTSVPHVQDWPAIHELLGDGRIARESVVVPGHSGDFLAGSHIPKWFAERSTVTRRAFLDAIEHAHYSLWDWPDGEGLRDRFDRRIEAVIGDVGDASPEKAADRFERWDLQERQAKFICNAVRVYEHAGLEWRLPLFDAELMDFWSRVPIDLRVGRTLYFAFAAARQVLPITPANTDYSPLVQSAVRGIDALGLRPLADRVRRRLRRARWRAVYDGSPLAWFALIDPEDFRRTYTGNELMHSYLARRYRDHVAALAPQHRAGP
jgi:asparagine synthase (glutamine-hydrolysing)